MGNNTFPHKGDLPIPGITKTWDFFCISVGWGGYRVMFFAASWMNMLYPAMLKPSKATLYSSVDISHVSSHSMIVTPNSNFCSFLMFLVQVIGTIVESGKNISEFFRAQNLHEFPLFNGKSKGFFEISP